MIINVCIILIGLSNIGLFFIIDKITKQIKRHETYILELCNILTEVFSKEDEDAETE